MLNKLVLVVCVLAAAPYFVSALYEVKIQETTNGFNVRPKSKTTNSLDPRIIGGEEVTPHQYPFQVVLLLHSGPDTYLCGGTLISNQWVLTAAHCLKMIPNYIVVVLGAHNLHDLSNPDLTVVQLFNTTKYKHHKGWSTYTKENDVGLVRLSKDATLNQYVQIAKLASNGTNKYVGREAITLGWGQTEDEDVSYVLRQVTSTIISNEDCANANENYKDIIKSMHICISGKGSKGSKGNCNGDSGGPLLVDGDQVGIVSFGTLNCTLGHPSVYTRVTDFRDWINQNTVDDGFDGNGDDDNGDDNGDNDDNDDGGASTHSLLFVAIASTVMCLVRSFGLL